MGVASNRIVKGEIYGVCVCNFFVISLFLDCLFREIRSEVWRWEERGEKKERTVCVCTVRHFQACETNFLAKFLICNLDVATAGGSASSEEISEKSSTKGFERSEWWGVDVLLFFP